MLLLLIQSTVALSASDTASLSATESVDAVVSVAVSDTASLALTDTSSLVAAVSATDTSTLSVTETTEIVATTIEQGGGWWAAFERDYSRHGARRKRDEEEAEEVEAIPDPVAREIAQLLHEQAAKDVERAELERLRSIARSYDGGEIDAKFNRALEVAANARSLAAARVLAQEVARVQEEDDFMMTAFMAVIDD